MLRRVLGLPTSMVRAQLSVYHGVVQKPSPLMRLKIGESRTDSPNRTRPTLKGRRPMQTDRLTNHVKEKKGKSQFWTRIGIGVTLSASSALLLTLAFPPWDLWPLVWVGFIPMLVAQYRILPSRVSSLAPGIAGSMGAQAIGGLSFTKRWTRWFSKWCEVSFQSWEPGLS